MKFSQRIGKTPIKNAFQLDSIDNDLRIGLWNCFYIYYLSKIRKKYKLIDAPSYNIFLNIWINFFKRSIDGLPESSAEIYSKMKYWFDESKWYEVYDFIEFISKVDLSYQTNDFKKACNITLEKEVKEIEEAIINSGKTIMTGVNIHLTTALSKLSDRKKPDYRNSIKESISAVEAISQIITRKPSATLGEALKVIEQNIELHGALKKGFESIYGYTSDADGIRHAMSDESGLDFEDAKYMLVSCSAFINYLIVKSDKSGIDFK